MGHQIRALFASVFASTVLTLGQAHGQTTIQAAPTAAPPSSDEDGEPVKVEFATDGSCLVAVNPSRPNQDDIGYARVACRDEMMPRRPTLFLQTPGAFFFGAAFGSDTKFVYGPAFGLGAGAAIPLRRPFLTYKGKANDKRRFVYPSGMSFVMDWLVSINGSLASVTTDEESDLGVVAGAYTGIQLGASWWPANERKDLLFAVGILAAYLNSDQTGDAFLLGVQPALLFKF